MAKIKINKLGHELPPEAFRRNRTRKGKWDAVYDNLVENEGKWISVEGITPKEGSNLQNIIRRSGVSRLKGFTGETVLNRSASSKVVLYARVQKVTTMQEPF
jgi:hypothetical protein